MWPFSRKKTAAHPNAAAELIAVIDSGPTGFPAIVDNWTPAECLMTLLAYGAAQPTLSAVLQIAGRDKIAFSIDDAIRSSFASFSKTQTTDEVGSRRHWWSMLAACVAKFDALYASSHPEDGARIWVKLLDSMQFAAGALEHNVIWSESEKKPFLSSLSPTTAFNNYVPRPYRPTQAFQRYAQDHDIAPIFLR